MVTLKEVNSTSIYGLEIISLEMAIEKAKAEEFYILYQSKVSVEAYGVLKPFQLKNKKGYLFTPIYMDGNYVTF